MGHTEQVERGRQKGRAQDERKATRAVCARVGWPGLAGTGPGCAATGLQQSPVELRAQPHPSWREIFPVSKKKTKESAPQRRGGAEGKFEQRGPAPRGPARTRLLARPDRGHDGRTQRRSAQAFSLFKVFDKQDGWGVRVAAGTRRRKKERKARCALIT